MEIIEHRTDSLITITPTAAAKVKELMAGRPIVRKDDATIVVTQR